MIANINPLDVEKITITLTTKDGDHTFAGKPTEGRSPFVTPTEKEASTEHTISKNTGLTVLRKIEFKPGNFKVGDQIKLNRGYTATCQKVKKNGTGFFLLDQVLPYKSNYDSIEYFLIHAFVGTDIFNPVVLNMVPFKDGASLRIPYEVELFGIDDFSGKEQWELMKNPSDRVAHTIETFGGHAETYWLWDDTYHTFCGYMGEVGYDGATFNRYNARYIRPVFKLSI